MPRWLVRSSIATSLAVAATAALAAEAGASSSVERLLSAAVAYGALSERSTVEAVRQACGEDPLCTARRIVAAVGERARLVPVSHPDSDTIRWVTTAPSVTAARTLPDGRRLVVLDGFGRKAVPELRAALAGGELEGGNLGTGLVLDLRGNGGGDLGRMIEVAAIFLPSVRKALYISGFTAKRPVDIEPASESAGGCITVLLGPSTASSGEILAALLRRHAGARLLGQRTAGKDFLYRVLPVDHDWRLLLPAERVVVPGEAIAGGLVPDGPIPAALESLVGRR